MIPLAEFDRIFLLEIGIGSAVFVIVSAVLLVSLVRRRAGAVAVPSSRSTARPAEIAYVVVLAAIAVFLVVVSTRATNRVAEAQAAPPEVVIDVQAFQWCWQFRHAPPGGGAPGAGPVADGTCQAPETRPTLVVPTGRPVALRLVSRDVVHAFWIPDLAVKRDVFPSYTNVITLTVDREGRWVGRCSEFCGNYHAMMEFWVRAVSPQEYAQYQATGSLGASA